MRTQILYRMSFALSLGLMLALSACQPEQQVASRTKAWIDAPRDRSVLPFAQYHVWTTVDSAGGLGQVELVVNGTSVGALNCEDPIQSLVKCGGAWNPPSPGDYRLEARAGGGNSAPVLVTVGQVTPTITPTVTRTGTTPPGVIPPVQIITVTPSATPTRIGTAPPGVIPPIQIITVTPSATPTRTGTPPPQAQPQPPPGCSGKPVISSFNASAINSGGSATLSWGSVSNADSVEISGIGGVATPGSRNVSPSVTTTYTLVAHCGSNTETRQATVNVATPTVTRTRTRTPTPTATRTRTRTPTSPPPQNPPAAPSSLTATDSCTSTTRRVNLRWPDVSGETGYKVYRGSTLIANMAAGNTAYTDNNPPSRRSAYTYGVEAFNNAGSSSRKTAQAPGCMD